METMNIAADPAVILFSVKESIIKAMSSQLNDFIDMRAIKVGYTDNLYFRISGNTVDAHVMAAVAGDYLVTAVKVG